MLALPADHLLSALLSFVGTVVLLASWLRFGGQQKLLAQPNARSSHVAPTPTGGGVALVIVVLLVLAGYWWAGIERAAGLALVLFGLALLGLADDLWELSAAIRLAVQTALTVTLLWASRSLVSEAPGDFSALSQPVLFAGVVLGLVWFLNLFNFMDGIDGLAAGQSAFYALAALLLGHGDPGWLGGVLWSVCAGSLGFLVFNAAPARIFMGDAGSAFLGLLLGWLALQLALAGLLPFVASLILLSAFWFDATYTLCVRMLTGQRFTQAHRSHLYQRLADRLGHGRTTLGYAALWLLWHTPLALWCRLQDTLSLWAAVGVVALACVPLLVGCLWLGAGRRVDESRP